MPQRIQLRRTKGWRKPEGAIVVSRPTIWGNPFRVFGKNEYLYCDASHRRTILTEWVVFDHDQDISIPATAQTCVDHFRRWLTGEFDAGGVVRPCAINPQALRGHDLACWCSLDQPCHADVLIELANN